MAAVYPLSAPIIILTAPNQELRNLTDLLDVVPIGETLPLRGKGELLPVLRSQTKVLSRPTTSSSVPSEVLHEEWPVSGNVFNSSHILKRTKASDSLMGAFVSNQQSEHQENKHFKIKRQSEPLITITAHIMDILVAVGNFSMPSASPSLTFSARSGKRSMPINSQRHRTSQIYRSISSLDRNGFKTWELVYTPLQLKQRQTNSMTMLQPVSIHKKRGKLGIMTVLKVINELNQSAIQPNGFYLGIPRYYEQIEVQFRLLMIRNGWDAWPVSYQHEMHTWSLAKKWLLIHQYELLAWLKKQCKADTSRSARMKVRSSTNSLNDNNLPAFTGKDISNTPVRTAYYHILRDWAHKLNKELR